MSDVNSKRATHNFNSQHNAIGAWFLGPQAENFVYLQKIFNNVAEHQMEARQKYFPDDLPFINSETQASPEFQESMKKLEGTLRCLMGHLSDHSVPFWSPRYMGHMNTDTSLPANVGYLTTMFFNQNNVSAEGGPLTTLIEIEVGKQLCEMVGYNIDSANKNEPVGWGHITCGARNLKFYPLSLRRASDHTEPLHFIADSFKVELCDGTQKLLKDCSTWEMLNIKAQTILDFTERLSKEYNISEQYLESVMHNYLIQTVGKDVLKKHFGVTKPTLYFVGATKHYSWPKAAAVTGIGSENLRNIPVNNAARMDPDALDKLLQQCLENQQAVYAVVTIMGSTEHGAVDPLSQVVKLREKYEKLGLTFVIHADAAWGGYFASMICKTPEDRAIHSPDPNMDYVPTLALRPYTENELKHLKFCDSITVDPHKSGYCPYPAGGLLYRDGRMKHMVTWTSPVVFQDSDYECVGIYGIEGSKPGSSSVGVWFSHEIIGLHSNGYGALLGEATFTCTKMYTHWATMSTDDTSFTVVPFNPLPAELEGQTSEEIEAQKEFIRQRIVNRSNTDLIHDEDALELIKKLGSDLIINTFACNFRIDGKVNENVIEANSLNRRIYERFSIRKITDKMNTKPLIITSTKLSQKAYGECLTNFKRRLGLKGDQDLYILVNVVMSPFPTVGNFIGELANEFKKVAEEEAKVSIKHNKSSPDHHGFIMQGTDSLYLVHLPMFYMENHNHQLILQAELPPDVMEKYIEVRQQDPKQIMMLGNIEETTLNDLMSKKEFKAEIYKGLPDGSGSYWMTGVPVKNVRVIKKRGLRPNYLDTHYPTGHMPFYLYGTEKQLHIDHLLVKAPNIHISADQVKLELESGTLDKTRSEIGVLAHITSINEIVMQPFKNNSTLEEGFIIKPGAKFDIELYDDPVKDPEANGPGLNDVSKTTPFAKGTITLGSNVWLDTDMLNEDHLDHPVCASQWRERFADLLSEHERYWTCPLHS
ncbi:1827_t:CDS:2 [Acaulospora morrowiae]|uniref:1827_t:CDS:1 n=1 Tax=Acaulospora morrowiae TaxID=94023 RepID=A0A9N9FTN8_9GLOM|nr:1827_t:CDS:2 [Acaulospora morrowiae]